MENTHNEHTGEHNHGHDHWHSQTESKEEFKISGDSIVAFLRRIFKAGNSRKVFCKNENGEKSFSINLILFIIILIFIPISFFLTILLLVATNYSLSIEKK
ncbi:MAG: DUF4342 domain-containing protein [bacterium]|nr:DUF4342 domain-containing protein [bacterium]